jgi:hypothetical protein
VRVRVHAELLWRYVGVSVLVDQSGGGKT